MNHKIMYKLVKSVFWLHLNAPKILLLRNNGSTLDMRIIDIKFSQTLYLLMKTHYKIIL